MDFKIKKYNECPIKYENGQAFIDYINENRHLLKEIPQVYQHGDITEPRMVKAKEALANWQEYERDHFYKSGNAMDEHGRGGFRAIWAEQLVELGADESLPQIQEQISNALNAFRGAILYSTPDDFSKKATFRGQPCRYYTKGSIRPLG